MIFLPVAAQAHQQHHETHDVSESELEEKHRQEKLVKTNELYKDKVKVIFQNKCFTCHSQNTVLPWYYPLPGAKQLIDSDIKEAKKHLDFSDDFPFKGHGTPSEDLDAIKEAVEENSMPPFRYRALHWGSGLKENEKKTILDWVHESKDILEKK